MEYYTFSDPPCKLDDVVNLNFSFENLHKFLNFLLLNDKESSIKINDTNTRLSQIDEFKILIEGILTKVDNYETKFSLMDNTLNSFSLKFNEFDKKIINTFQVNFYFFINYFFILTEKKFI